MYDRIRVVAAVNRNRISVQNLRILQEKYGMDDMDACRKFCEEKNIIIYDEEKVCAASIQETVVQKKQKTPEEIHVDKLVKKVTQRIMHVASVKALKRVSDIPDARGWLCGTYTSRVSELVLFRVKRLFNVRELEFILDHLTDENDEDIAFEMKDEKFQKICDELNRKLNDLIPRLHVNMRYYNLLV